MGYSGDDFGFSVAESAGQIPVGAPWHSGGPAYVFSASGASWRQSAEVTGGSTQRGDQFGWSVALATGCAVVGAPGRGAGQAYVFTRAYVFSRALGGWRQTAELAGPRLFAASSARPRQSPGLP